MSTRGAIARPKGDGWEGVYQHWDSYPSGLGQRLWHAVASGQMTPDEIAAYALEHKGGWSSFGLGDDGICYCHTRGEGDSEMLIDGARCGSRDGDGCEDGGDGGCNPLFIEWVYVLSGHVMTIFGHYDTGRRLIRGEGARQWDSPRYAHRIVAQVDFRNSEAEPDWEAIEQSHEAWREANEPTVAA